jgi:GxxExxY protein
MEPRELSITTLNEVSGEVVDSSMKVHSFFGPGLLESAYGTCLTHELRKRGLDVRTQVPQPIKYQDLLIDVGYRIDLLVEEAVVVELKAIAKVIPVHEAQLLSYLRLGNYKLGLLINFHVPHLKDGITRLVNGL